MHKTFPPVWKAAFFLSLGLMLISCRTKSVSSHIPAPNVEEIAANAASELQRSHLYAWRQAESLYRKAYALAASDALKDKLLLTRFLILTREVDEDILDPAMERSFNELCANPSNARQKALCDLVGPYTGGIGSQNAEQRRPWDPILFDAENSPLDAYIYSLYMQAYGLKETNEKAGERLEKFRDSPLFIYLYLGEKTARRADELEKAFPEFAELFDFLGGAQFQKARYSAAKAYYKKALQLIPDYTRSMNGLGNFYLFALEDYEKSLEYYSMALERNPGNAPALFGAARTYHSLGRYSDSNALLDIMLQSDLSRGGRTSDQSVRYYRGEANYYKAYNLHLSGDDEKARAFIETAKGFLPMSDHVNYLSGLLYYNARQLRNARDDFKKVLESGANLCDAHYYLGRIYRESNEELDERPPEQTAGVHVPKELAELLKQVPVRNDSKPQQSLNYFLGACACLESNIRGLTVQIRSIPAMDLDPDEKLVFEGRLQNKLLNYRQSSDTMIERMLSLSASADTEKKDEYLALMKDVQKRIGVPGDAASSPHTRP